MISVTKWQKVDLDQLEVEISGFKTKRETSTYLSQNYPCLYIFVLNSLDMNDRVHKYMQDCKSFESDSLKYSIYVHGFFIPWLDL